MFVKSAFVLVHDKTKSDLQIPCNCGDNIYEFDLALIPVPTMFYVWCVGLVYLCFTISYIKGSAEITGKNITVIGKTIPVLEEGIFANLPYLQTLVLEDCGIQNISKDAFNKITHLKWLSLATNEISELGSGTFGTLNELNTLDLSYNQIWYIDEHTFYGMPNLTSIFLQHNRLVNLHRDMFKSNKLLSHLQLEYNRLTCLPIEFFENLVSVTSIRLENNNLSCFCSPTIVKWMTMKNLTNSLSNNLCPRLFG